MARQLIPKLKDKYESTLINTFDVFKIHPVELADHASTYPHWLSRFVRYCAHEGVELKWDTTEVHPTKGGRPSRVAWLSVEDFCKYISYRYRNYRSYQRKAVDALRLGFQHLTEKVKKVFDILGIKQPKPADFTEAELKEKRRQHAIMMMEKLKARENEVEPTVETVQISFLELAKLEKEDPQEFRRIFRLLTQEQHDRIQAEAQEFDRKEVERKRAEALEALLKKEREWDRQQREVERLENLEWLEQYNAKKSGYYVDEYGTPCYEFLEEDDDDEEIKYQDPD